MVVTVLALMLGSVTARDLKAARVRQEHPFQSRPRHLHLSVDKAGKVEEVLDSEEADVELLSIGQQRLQHPTFRHPPDSLLDSATDLAASPGLGNNASSGVLLQQTSRSAAARQDPSGGAGAGEWNGVSPDKYDQSENGAPAPGLEGENRLTDSPLTAMIPTDKDFKVDSVLVLPLFLMLLVCLCKNLCFPTKLDDLTKDELQADGNANLSSDPMAEEQLGNYEPDDWADGRQLMMMNAVGSTFRRPGMLRQQLFVLVLFGCFLCLWRGVKESDTIKKDVTNISTYFMTLMPFFFAMYLVMIFNRWWAMRTQGIGTVWQVTMDLCQLMAAYLPGKENAPVKELTLRYGLLCFDLVFMHARKEVNLDELVRKGYLMEGEEKEALKQCQAEKGNLPHAVWVWQLGIWSRLLKEGKVEVFQAKKAQSLICDGRAAVKLIFTHITCQVPLAWVHLMTTLVNIAVLTVCMRCSVIVDAIIDDPLDPACGTVVFCLADGKIHLNKTIRISLQMVFVLIVPFILWGFLAFTNALINPFGYDSVDFPRMRYLKGVKNEGRGILLLGEKMPTVVDKLGRE